jgi:MoxR-like ATPase
MRRSMEQTQEHQLSEAELAQVEEMGAKKSEIISEIKKVIVGQDKVIEEILITLFCRGHCLLVGVPGLAKTLLISTLAGIMELISTGFSSPQTSCLPTSREPMCSRRR